ncbi:hypothetical protein CWR48_02505 [Oceanobacillus arenosus]|uniref:NERD domain-containing protein n=1 Tax=Oceanobacillus arenosus TaxID=1229153 RepID=A0A3D8PZ89_9BACI|nr:nuclease-related domain-containing protein [Oceanobacillus arenosus]RDW21303.1 hypothetical protein CWR48_02505 [Oceanobacillus arenosus]
MFIKPFTIPKHILEMEALAKRLVPMHPEKQSITLQAGNIRAGYDGELSLQYPLSFLPYHQYLIFHYIRIPDSNGFFQIDLLILSTNFILIIEVKNIRDTITFDEMGQSVRKSGDNETIFSNPIDQVNLQHLRLLHWIRKFEFPPIPIEKIVVYSNPSTLLKNRSNDSTIPKITIRKEKLLSKIEELASKYVTPSFNEEQLIDLTAQLLDAHVPEKANAMKRYGIANEELLMGVICPRCEAIPMNWSYGRWTCIFCGCKSTSAHKKALADYGLLVSNLINNRQAREFLIIDSEHTVRRLLQKEDLDKYGRSSGRKYIIDPEKLMFS